MARRVLPAALMVLIAAVSAAAAQQPLPAALYADSVTVRRVRDSLAAPWGTLIVPPLPPEPTFRIQVFGRRPFVVPFDEWLAADLPPTFRQTQGGVDVLPLILSAVKSYRTARARKQAAGELAEFLRTHPQDP